MIYGGSCYVTELAQKYKFLFGFVFSENRLLIVYQYHIAMENTVSTTLLHMTVFKITSMRGWRDGSMAMDTGCSPGGSGLSSQHPHSSYHGL